MHEVIGTPSLPEPLHAMKQNSMYERDLRETDTHLGQGALFRNRINGTGGVGRGWEQECEGCIALFMEKKGENETRQGCVDVVSAKWDATNQVLRRGNLM
jgi:hypothetical protein